MLKTCRWSVSPALFFRKVAVVLCQALRRAVVKLGTAQRLAVGVEGVEADVVAHPHGDGDLQAIVVGGLVRLEQQHGTEQRVGPPCEDVRAGTGGGGVEHRVVDVTGKRQVAAVRPDISRSHAQLW